MLPELPFSFQRPSDVTFLLLRAFLNHHLVLALGLLLTERSPSPTAEKQETEERDVLMHPAELPAGNLGI
jgi:hypothetical protein